MAKQKQREWSVLRSQESSTESNAVRGPARARMNSELSLGVTARSLDVLVKEILMEHTMHSSEEYEEVIGLKEETQVYFFPRLYCLFKCSESTQMDSKDSNHFGDPYIQLRNTYQ